MPEVNAPPEADGAGGPAGDAAFEALVERWQGRVFALARRFFRDPQDAEDVCQEVFLKVHRALGSYRADAPFEHWLLRIATNACRDRLREHRRRPEQVLSQVTDDAQRWLDAVLEGAALEVAQVQRARDLAADLLDALPEKDRIVLVLMDLEGKTAAEVAAITGSTRGAVKVRALRARRALRKLAGRLVKGRGEGQEAPAKAPDSGERDAR